MSALHTFDEEETKKLPATSVVGHRRMSLGEFADWLDTPTLKRSAVRPVPPPDGPARLIEQATIHLDRASNGHGEELLRIISFLIVGGSAALVNLVAIFVLDRIFRPTPADVVLYLVLSGIATEISVIENFSLNDRFTFRSLIDARRTWLQRCIRFHGPASVGYVLTLAISYSTFRITHIAVVSQAIAIVIVTAVNFAMHRFWTYRPKAVEQGA
jgi:putative flippase GtrA